MTGCLEDGRLGLEYSREIESRAVELAWAVAEQVGDSAGASSLSPALSQ